MRGTENVDRFDPELSSGSGTWRCGQMTPSTSGAAFLSRRDMVYLLNRRTVFFQSMTVCDKWLPIEHVNTSLCQLLR